MARSDWLSRSGLLIGVLVTLILMVVLIGWLRQPRQAVSARDAKLPAASPPGWEIRYSASVALARRGSDAVQQSFDTFEEMLNEEQQLANFRIKKDNKEIADEVAAQETVINALKALEELHRRRPDIDLSQFGPALDKLRQGPTMALRTEAERTQIALRSK